MKTTNTIYLLKNAISDYIWYEVPLEDFDTAEDLKDALMETLEAVVETIIDEEIEFEEEEE